MMPEVVNWKTGGVLKSVSTAFIVKGDVNGRLRGARSKTTTSNPIRLLVRCPEGTEVTEYQLIRLRTHSDAREFRTVTGGVFHASGNSSRDDLPFDSQHVAPHTWTIPLGTLRAGEYGLLPPKRGVPVRSLGRCTRLRFSNEATGAPRNHISRHKLPA